MGKQPISFYASLAEIISALAIIITLIYAVNEYKRSDVLTNSDIRSLLYEREENANDIIATDPQFAAIYYKVINGEKITPVEKMQYLSYRENVIDSWQMAWDSHKAGIMTEADWQGWDRYFKLEAKDHPAWSWFDNKSQYQDPDFLVYMGEFFGDKLKEETP